jgi:ATPase subunit of ABC transporter with duplicated ATPase domains
MQTLIKIITGEHKSSSGTVWRHPNLRMAYVAQHAFHHLEEHLDTTPLKYMFKRFGLGEDKVCGGGGGDCASDHSLQQTAEVMQQQTADSTAHSTQQQLYHRSTACLQPLEGSIAGGPGFAAWLAVR